MSYSFSERNAVFMQEIEFTLNLICPISEESHSWNVVLHLWLSYQETTFPNSLYCLVGFSLNLLCAIEDVSRVDNSTLHIT